jgi:hypothetical protein
VTTLSGVKVSLQWSDWVRIIAIVVTIGLALAGAFLRHDRMLGEVLANVQQQERRLQLLEQRLWDVRVPHSGLR